MESTAKEITVTETAVTLPSDLVQKTEELALQLGVSRDELYRRALRRFLAAYHETEVTRRLNEVYQTELATETTNGSPDSLEDSEITRKLNEVYAHEDSSPDPVLTQLQFETLEREDW